MNSPSHILRLCCALSLLLSLSWTTSGNLSHAAVQHLTTDQRIARVKQERKRLANVKNRLERQLGSIGKELRQLDASLIEARKTSRQAHAKLLATDQQLVQMKRRSRQLKQQISSMKEAMLQQAVSAWQRSSHASLWMGALTGVSVSDIPHRRFLLNTVMRSQQHDREAYIASVAELAKLKIALTGQRKKLMLVRQESQQAAAKLSARAKDKRNMIHRVQKKVRSEKKKDNRLARQEKALMQLLGNMREDLLAIDQDQAAQQNIRKRKGHLKWPIRGHIVASFRSRPKASMPRLQGVQLRPGQHVKEVRSMAAGQVRYADWFGGYGLMTIVDYGNGLLGVYAHNDVLYKQLGDWVEEGEIIADAGSTGWVNKVTLYFEIRDKGKPVNPKRWCRR